MTQEDLIAAVRRQINTSELLARHFRKPVVQVRAVIARLQRHGILLETVPLAVNDGWWSALVDVVPTNAQGQVLFPVVVGTVVVSPPPFGLDAVPLPRR